MKERFKRFFNHPQSFVQRIPIETNQSTERGKKRERNKQQEGKPLQRVARATLTCMAAGPGDVLKSLCSVVFGTIGEGGA